MLAKICRTWASLTQIQGAYVAEEIYGKGKVLMSEELGRTDVDMRLNLDIDKIFIQIKNILDVRECDRLQTMKIKIQGIEKSTYYFMLLPILTSILN